MATVKHVEHDDGTHSIGVELDGRYVPFATLDPARVEQLASSEYYNPPKSKGGKPEGGEK